MLEKLKIRIKQSEKKKEIDWGSLEQELSRGISSEVIKGVVVEMFKLAQKLKEKAYFYDSIVSDDASGRLVSLFLKKVLDTEREKKERNPLKLRFIATGRHNVSEVYEKIKEYLNLNRGELGRVLLVTEFIATGTSIKKIANILEDLNIFFDVAALTVSRDISRGILDKIKPGKSARWELYYGDISIKGGDLSNIPSMTGVEKKTSDKDMSPFPKRFYGYYDRSKDSQEEKQELHQSVVEARRDVEVLAERVSKLLDKYDE